MGAAVTNEISGLKEMATESSLSLPTARMQLSTTQEVAPSQTPAEPADTLISKVPIPRTTGDQLLSFVTHQRVASAQRTSELRLALSHVSNIAATAPYFMSVVKAERKELGSRSNRVCFHFSKKSKTFPRCLLQVPLARNESHSHCYCKSSWESEEGLVTIHYVVLGMRPEYEKPGVSNLRRNGMQATGK